MSWLSRWRDRRKNHQNLHVEVRGQGDLTLVFVPGLGGTTRYWAARTKSMEDRYRIVLVDLLGFGKSPKPWTQYSVERHVSELRVVLKDFDQFSLVGHSLGALLTAAYAARFPSQIRNIFLMGMPYFSSELDAQQYFHSGKIKGGFLYTNVVLTTITCILTRRVFGRILPRLVRHVPREVAEDLVTHTWRSSTSSLWEVVYRHDAAEDFACLPTNLGVVFIHGDEDTMAPLSALRRLTDANPSWAVHVLAGVDHHPWLRNPDECVSLIDAKMAERGLRPENGV